MTKVFTDAAREQLEDLKNDVTDYQKEVENSKVELVNARETLRSDEVRWAKAVIALDEFKQEYGL